MNERIAERIRMLRLQKGLSQQNIADELNLTVAAYSNIERGITGINLERLYQLSEIFNISIAEMLQEAQTVKEPNYYENSNTTSVQLSILTQQLSILQQQVNALQAEMFSLKSKFN
jgi:transcriptional regulator with XRE-family HTH domain